MSKEHSEHKFGLPGGVRQKYRYLCSKINYLGGWLSKHTKAQRTILKTYKIATYNAQNLQNRPGRGQLKRTKAQRTKSQRTKVYRPMGKAYNGKSNNDQNVQNWNVQWQIKQTRIIQNCNLQNEMIVSYKIASSKIGRYKMPLVDAG